MPRLHIESLCQTHGVMGLAKKLGVGIRTVQRWRNEDVDPSPLAREKLFALQATTAADEAGPTRRRPSTPDLPVSASAGVVPSRRVGA